jgi:hypothetical protein
MGGGELVEADWRFAVRFAHTGVDGLVAPLSNPTPPPKFGKGYVMLAIIAFFN